MSELLRPWKLATLGVGILALIAGAFLTPAPDWDVGISLIMAALAYTTAPWSVRMVVARRWRLWPLVAVVTWVAVDGCYAAYWSWKDPAALTLMRDANAPASLSLYVICGLIWLPRASVRELFAAVGTNSAVRSSRRLWLLRCRRRSGPSRASRASSAPYG